MVRTAVSGGPFLDQARDDFQDLPEHLAGWRITVRGGARCLANHGVAFDSIMVAPRSGGPFQFAARFGDGYGGSFEMTMVPAARVIRPLRRTREEDEAAGRQILKSQKKPLNTNSNSSL